MESPLRTWLINNGFDPENLTPIARALLDMFDDAEAVANILMAVDKHVPGWAQLVKQF